jgi:hypothetical protein
LASWGDRAGVVGAAIMVIEQVPRPTSSTASSRRVPSTDQLMTRKDGERNWHAQ